MQNKIGNSLQGFGDIVSQALTRAFRESCTSALNATVGSEEPALLPVHEELVYFSVGFNGSLQGRARLSVKKADITTLGIRDVPVTQEPEMAALLHLLQTMTLQMQELATARYGGLTVSVEQAAEPAPPDVKTTLYITVSSGDVDTLTTLYLDLEPQLVTALQAPSGVLFPEAAPAEQTSPENLELVLDVELTATLRFGQRQLTLREVLELTSGSVVELDRQVDEPVELVLDGRVIARGEAVIIDDNYGMRITEVLQSVNGGTESR